MMSVHQIMVYNHLMVFFRFLGMSDEKLDIILWFSPQQVFRCNSRHVHCSFYGCLAMEVSLLQTSSE